MGRIRVLPEHLANRIAAGEVVERPASVVKELVENALDAGASSVEVVIEAGGSALIRVTDDGSGMDRDDLALAVERHATSKIATPEDLDSVSTLGFRGEALAAIASVSLMTLTTSEAAGPGWRLQVRGGRVESLETAAAPPGTCVEVASLFFNTPARRKFLKSPGREASLVAETVTNLALAHPERGFALSSDGRKVLSLPAGSDLRERAARLLGAEEPLLEARWEGGGIHIEAHTSGAGESRPDRSAQRVLVNGRPVRDKTIAHAISGVYGPVLPPGRFPILALSLVAPPSEVDVNVHPAKSEVRFRRPGEIHGAVTAALRRALGPVRGLKSLPAADVAAAFEGMDALPPPLPLAAETPLESVREATGPSWETATDSAAVAAWTHRTIVGQYRNSYVVAADGDGLLVVDQHAAHERVLFERILAGATAREIQPLLSPALVEVPAPLRLLLPETLPALEAMGFEAEAFGDSAAVVRAVPAEFAGHDPAHLLRDILSDLGRDRQVVDEGDGSRFPGEDTRGRMRRAVAASAACQAAVKVNFTLGQAKMAWLLDALERCRDPKSCPHGRPTVLRLEHERIERAFLRPAGR